MPGQITTGPSVEVTPPEALRDPLRPVLAPDPSGVQLPVKPLEVLSKLTVTPWGKSQVSEVLEISVQFDVSNAYAPTPVAVEFTDPGGRTYQREEATLGLVPPTVDRLTYTMPVAATAIDSNKLTGLWTVKLLVESKEISALTFELTR